MKTETVKNEARDTMNSASSKARDTMNSTTSKAEQVFNRAGEALEDIQYKISDATSKFRDSGSEYASRSVDLIKKYPVQAAVGATILGLAVGFFMARPAYRDSEQR